MMDFDGKNGSAVEIQQLHSKKSNRFFFQHLELVSSLRVTSGEDKGVTWRGLCLPFSLVVVSWRKYNSIAVFCGTEEVVSLGRICRSS